MIARAGQCELLTSSHALEEARRNLALKSRRFEFGHLFGEVKRGTRVVTLGRAIDLVLKKAGV